MSSNIKRLGGEILKFKECREKAGLSQREVGDRLGISDSAVCLWEREEGGSLPRASMLPAIAKLYGVTVDELLSDQDEGKEGYILWFKFGVGMLLTFFAVFVSLFSIAAICVLIQSIAEHEVTTMLLLKTLGAFIVSSASAICLWALAWKFLYHSF